MMMMMITDNVLLQVLLDAAVMEMQQYSTVVARVNATPPSPQPSTPQATPAANTTTAAAAEAEAEPATASSDKKESGETGETGTANCRASSTTETSETVSAITPPVSSSPGRKIFGIFSVLFFNKNISSLETSRTDRNAT